ncbi:MAG: DUF1189 domain-containing protein [Lachnospiraceae bacterium]|nr:DUF1189 domain-containing protein [Lachnospiraceae bacterium]
MNNNDNMNDDDQKFKNEQEKLNDFLKEQMNKDGGEFYKKMKDNANKMPFYMQMLTSFRSSKYYVQFLSIKGGRVALYFFFMTFIAAIFAVIVPLTGRMVGIGGVKNFIVEKIPDFSYENGVLTSESTMQFEKQGIQFYLDSSVAKYSEDDIDKDSILQVLVSKSNIVINEAGRVYIGNFNEMPKFKFSKDLLLDSIPFIYLIIFLAGLISYFSLMYLATELSK